MVLTVMILRWSSTAAMHYPLVQRIMSQISMVMVLTIVQKILMVTVMVLLAHTMLILMERTVMMTDEFTFPGAGFNELSPLNEECLTDADGDGYAAGVQNSLYESNVNSGDCFDITIADSYSDGCGAFADMYIDSVLVTSIEGPTSGLADEDNTMVCFYDRLLASRLDRRYFLEW